MHVQKHNKDQWYKCALYEVWRNMMRDARRMFNRNFTGNTPDGFPVDPMFRDYDKFVVWARICRKYKIGEMDDYRIERYNLNKWFYPDNCFFTKDPPAYVLAEVSEITPGAKCEWKENKCNNNRWNGLSRTRLYEIWKGMNRRCTDSRQKDYPDYGGRGISVCELWKNDFISFYNWAWDHGYSPFLSLDRIDVDKNYCPDNCRWSGELEQKLNQRKYNQMYKNLRLKVKDMRSVLDNMDDDVVVTLVARTSYIPDPNVQEADYPAVPVQDRIDSERKKKVV